MPAWDFKCSSCGVVSEVWFKSFSQMEKAAPHLCPECEAPAERLPASGAFILKGHGFHKHDYPKVIDSRHKP
jgi:putative FmdB family regulatory protein